MVKGDYRPWNSAESSAEPQPASTAPKVFISHASEDKNRFVLPFATTLRARGLDAWVDVWEILPGDSLNKRIFEEGIGSSDTVIAVISEASRYKPWVREELDAANIRRMSGGCKIIAVRLDDVPVPTALSGLAWVDIDCTADYTAAIDRIVQAVLDRRGRPPLGTLAADAMGLASDPMSEFRRHLAEPSQLVWVQNRMRDATSKTLGELDEGNYPVWRPEVTGESVAPELGTRLSSYERDLDELVDLVVAGAHHGDRSHDDMWVRAVSRLVDRRSERIGSFDAHWLAAELYPPLVLTYGIGLAALAGGRGDLVGRALVRTSREVNGRPLVRELAPHRVVDPALAAKVHGWAAPDPQHALSTHLREALRGHFVTLFDDQEYGRAFEDYEYLRCLLEIHHTAFTAGGEFARALVSGRSRVAERVVVSDDLLNTGAFDGSRAAVGEAAAQLKRQLSSRYV